MLTLKDELIFACGVVNNAAAGGRIAAPEDIRAWLQAAQDAFRQVYGEPGAPQAFQAPASPTAQPAQRGPQPASGAFLDTANQAVMSSFDSWADKACYIGGKDAAKWTSPSGKLWRDTTWRELMELCCANNQKAINLLAWAAKQPPGNDPKWAENDKRKISNAKAVLHMAEQMRKVGSLEIKEETPF